MLSGKIIAAISTSQQQSPASINAAYINIKGRSFSVILYRLMCTRKQFTLRCISIWTSIGVSSDVFSYFSKQNYNLGVF